LIPAIRCRFLKETRDTFWSVKAGDEFPHALRLPTPYLTMQLQNARKLRFKKNHSSAVDWL
jgi:hypothetical protein